MNKMTQAEFMQHVDANDGLCLACRTFTSGGVEPDAEGYECEECGENEVCGTEQALLNGEIEIEDDPETDG